MCFPESGGYYMDLHGLCKTYRLFSLDFLTKELIICVNLEGVCHSFMYIAKML